jgi:hypothetical protein
VSYFILRFPINNLRFFLGGVIPDSTMIHAARKRRQMARETGAGGVGSDYITLNDSGDGGNDLSIIKTVSANRKSRLIRYEIVFFFKANKK